MVNVTGVVFDVFQCLRVVVSFSQVESDLETMWQVASADNRRMKQSVKHTIERLKKHPHLHDLLSDEEGRDDNDI